MSSHEWILIDSAVPWKKNIVKAEQATLRRYLAGQIGEMYKVAAQVLLFVAAALGNISKIERFADTRHHWVCESDCAVWNMC